MIMRSIYTVIVCDWLEIPLSKQDAKLKMEVIALEEINMMTMMNRMMANEPNKDEHPKIIPSQSKQPIDTKESSRKCSFTFLGDNSSKISLCILCPIHAIFL